MTAQAPAPPEATVIPRPGPVTAGPVAASPASVSAAVAARRSCRAFLDRPVEQSLLRQLTVAAARAASGGNLQPWHVDIVTGAALDRLRTAVADKLASGALEAAAYQIYPSPLVSPYRERRFEIGEQLYAALGVAREDKAGRQAQFARNFSGFGAPALMFLTVDRGMGPPQWSDLGGFLAQILLLATEAGLGTCAQESWAMFPGTVGTHLGTPPERMLFCGVAIGWPEPDAPINRFTAPRADPEAWLRFHA